MAMNKKYQNIKFITVRVTTSESTDRTQSAYNMQVLQDWYTFHWSRMPLLSDPAAKLIRMKVHVFSDATKIGGRMERTRMCHKTEVGSPKSAIHLPRTTRCFRAQHQEAPSDVSERAQSRIQ